MPLQLCPSYSTFEQYFLTFITSPQYDPQQHDQVKRNSSHLFIPRPKIVNEQHLIQIKEYVPLTIQSCLYSIVLEGLLCILYYMVFPLFQCPTRSDILHVAYYSYAIMSDHYSKLQLKHYILLLFSLFSSQIIENKTM